MKIKLHFLKKNLLISRPTYGKCLNAVALNQYHNVKPSDIYFKISTSILKQNI